MYIRYVRRRHPSEVIRTPDKIIEEHEIRTNGQTILILSMASGLKYQVVITPIQGSSGRFEEKIYLLSADEPVLVRTRDINAYQKKLGVHRYENYIEGL